MEVPEPIKRLGKLRAREATAVGESHRPVPEASGDTPVEKCELRRERGGPAPPFASLPFRPPSLRGPFPRAWSPAGRRFSF
jgi:hypothetical protein